MGGDLLSRIEERRVATLADLDAGIQARLGQFFTPEGAAHLIARMPDLPESEFSACSPLKLAWGHSLPPLLTACWRALPSRG